MPNGVVFSLLLMLLYDMHLTITNSCLYLMKALLTTAVLYSCNAVISYTEFFATEMKPALR